MISYQRAGTIFSLNMAGQPVVVLNDAETCADLLGMQPDACILLRCSHVAYVYDDNLQTGNPVYTVIDRILPWSAKS